MHTHPHKAPATASNGTGPCTAFCLPPEVTTACAHTSHLALQSTPITTGCECLLLTTQPLLAALHNPTRCDTEECARHKLKIESQHVLNQTNAAIGVRSSHPIAAALIAAVTAAGQCSVCSLKHVQLPKSRRNQTKWSYRVESTALNTHQREWRHASSESTTQAVKASTNCVTQMKCARTSQKPTLCAPHRHGKSVGEGERH